MQTRFVFTFATVLGLLAALLLAAAASAAVPVTVPAEWRESDLDRTPMRYAIEVAVFPSTTLAGGVQGALIEAGWGPVSVERSGNESAVLLGDFDSVAEARFVLEELAIHDVAQGRIIPRTRQSGGEARNATGPFLAPFTLTPGVAEQPAEWSRVRVALDSLVARVPEADRPRIRRAVEALDSPPAQRAFEGAAAAAVAQYLMADRRNLDAAFYLAERVALGDWEAGVADRLACGEIFADLAYQLHDDWRAAWSATRDLLSHTARTPDGRLRDMLRQAALEVELASQAAGAARPTWGQIRTRLRVAQEATGSDPRARARISLLYLQTFAWEGNWARVEELASAYPGRYPNHRGEAALAQYWQARSLERTSSWERAIALLNPLIDTPVPVADALHFGEEPLDLADLARRTRERFLIASGAGLPDEAGE